MSRPERNRERTPRPRPRREEMEIQNEVRAFIGPVRPSPELAGHYSAACKCGARRDEHGDDMGVCSRTGCQRFEP